MTPRSSLWTLVLLSACWQHSTTTPRARDSEPGLQLQLHRIDDQGDDRLYLYPVDYRAWFSCGASDHHLSYREAHGAISSGELILQPPFDCDRPASFDANFWPLNSQRCSSKHIGPVDVGAYRFTGLLVVKLSCESAMRSAKLQALPILDCDETATAIARTGPQTFRAEGCGRHVDMLCDGDPYGEEYFCDGMRPQD